MPAFTRRPVLAVPVTILFLLIGATALLLFVTDRDPEIERLEPAIGADGDVITITGRNFGDERGASSVWIAGRRLTASRYLDWSDTEISVALPDFSESGLVVVATESGESEGVLLRHRDEVPRADGAGRTTARVTGFSPDDPAVGDVLVISGDGFGERRAGAEVEFSGIDGAPLRPAPDDYAYDYWSPDEIRVRIPSGAGSGPVRLIFPEHDNVNRHTVGSVDVRRVGGEIRLGDRLQSVVERNIRIRGLESRGENGRLLFWMPRVPDRVQQREAIVLSENSPQPLPLDDGMLLYEWPADGASPRVGIRRTELFERAALWSDLSAGSVRTTYDTDWELYRRYTAPRDGLPLDEAVVEANASSARANNPLVFVRNVYSWMISNLEWSEDGSADVVEVLDTGSGNAAGIADSFVAILRAGGVPARPVRGALVVEPGDMPFYSWAEFYLSGFGWVPADPARAAGAGAHYGFGDDIALGELDNRVIEFRAGVPETPIFHPDATRRRDTGVYAPRAVVYELKFGEISSVDWPNPLLLGSRIVD